MTLIFVRHGVTDFNLQKRFQGQLNVHLNADGRKQVLLSSELLKNHFEQNKILESQVQFYASDSLRCVESAEIICKTMPNLVQPQLKLFLREFDSGIFTGRTASEIEAESNSTKVENCSWKKYMSDYDTSPFSTRWPGPTGESKQIVLLRLKSFLTSLQTSAYKNLQNANPKNTTLICTHGGIVQLVLEWFKITQPNKPLFVGNADICILEAELNINSESGLKWALHRHYKIGGNTRASV
jgi:broad specificity phosphatase PhoE